MTEQLTLFTMGQSSHEDLADWNYIGILQIIETIYTIIQLRTEVLTMK